MSKLDGIRVVLVDDSPEAVELLGELLRIHGADVVAVGSAREAFSRVVVGGPQILIADIAMPDEDGLSLIRRVRALPPSEGGKTPALAVTGYATARDRLAALEAGFDAHLGKPVDIDEFLAAVESLARHPPLQVEREREARDERERTQGAEPQAIQSVRRAHPLAGVFARLDRADENILNLVGEIGLYKKLNPTGGGTEYDPQTGRVTYTIAQSKPPDLKLSVLVGEVLFLLRSSLDHLVAQILVAITPADEIDRVLERSQFPISTSTSGFERFDWAKLPGIAPEVRAAITRCQPCHRRDGLPPEDHPLAILANFNNTDKHRLLLILANRLTVRQTSISLHGEGSHFKELRVSHEGPTFSSTGELQAEVAVGTVHLGAGGGVEMDAKYSLQIAFKSVGTREGVPVLDTLRDLSTATREVVERFRTLFFQ